MAPKFTHEAPIKFADDVQETSRRNVNTRIAELQQQTSDLTVAPGRTLGRLVLTSSGSDSVPDGTKTLDVEMVGGGGGGGGGQGGVGTTAAAGGGGSGVYLALSVDVGPTPVIKWTAGAAGGGGSTAPTSGSNGGDTTLVVNGKTYTAKGGGGGTSQAATLGASGAQGGRPLAGSSPGDKTGGTAGEDAFSINGVFFSGAGGSNPMGAGGPDVGGGQAGLAALGPGGGGGGGCATAAGQVGGDGGAGKLIVWARS